MYSHAGRLFSNYNLLNSFLESFDVSSTCCCNKLKFSFFFFLPLLQKYDINFSSIPSESFEHSFVKGHTLACTFTAMVKAVCHALKINK